jgi:hypothetical protein
MILNVPFQKQTSEVNCGPGALRLVVSYLDKDPGIELIEEKAGIVHGKGVSTLQLAVAAASFGYKTKFFSQHLTVNLENLELDFYKKYHANPEAYSAVKESEELLARARSIGVIAEEKTLTLDKLLFMVTKTSVPIVLVDWNVINNHADKGYQGHFVPIIGYDEENVYIHNVSYTTPQARMPILKSVFDKARKSKGTDEDILIVYKK